MTDSGSWMLEVGSWIFHRKDHRGRREVAKG